MTCRSLVGSGEDPVLDELAKSGGNYDVFVFVAYRSDTYAQGTAYPSSVCSPYNDRRWNFNMAYRPQDCDVYEPPTPIDCTPTNRIVLTSQVYVNFICKTIAISQLSLITDLL